MKAPTGFTLVEAVSVVAINAMLVSLVFPMLANARDRALMAKSLNNVRQLASATQRYMEDYAETLPGWMNNNPGPAGPLYAHNCWDEQLSPYVRDKGIYSNGSTGIKSSAQPNPHDRTLTYGLNGCLIGAYSGGHANYTGISGANPPAPSRLPFLADPAGVILFAELSTVTYANKSAYNAFTVPPPFTARAGSGAASRAWLTAWVGWVDIDPYDFITITSGDNDFVPPFTNATGWGVARNLYGGGGCYAFCDGHVQFMRLAQTVGIGRFVGSSAISRTNWASVLNIYNMWNPRAKVASNSAR